MYPKDLIIKVVITKIKTFLIIYKRTIHKTATIIPLITITVNHKKIRGSKDKGV
jgi:hypothetical protein